MRLRMELPRELGSRSWNLNGIVVGRSFRNANRSITVSGRPITSGDRSLIGSSSVSIAVMATAPYERAASRLAWLSACLPCRRLHAGAPLSWSDGSSSGRHAVDPLQPLSEERNLSAPQCLPDLI
jgi:hypothetical protein